MGTSYRSELPRIYELRDFLKNPGLSNTYFQDFDNSIAAEPKKQRHLKDIESDLRGLDNNAWDFLKKKVAPCFEQKNNMRGWQQAFDLLNEAKGYKYLISLGCQDVKFIPRSENEDQETPDLKGVLGSTLVLCEVKTINPSDDEAKGRQQTIRHREDSQTSLPDSFFNKLTKTLKKAKSQMESYCLDAAPRKIAYVVINPDDLLNEHAEKYSEQLELYKKEVPVCGIEIVFDTKPAFYPAMA